MQLLNKTEQNAYPEGKSKLVKEMAVLTVPDLTLKRAGGGGGAVKWTPASFSNLKFEAFKFLI